MYEIGFSMCKGLETQWKNVLKALKLVTVGPSQACKWNQHPRTHPRRVGSRPVLPGIPFRFDFCKM